uniref:Uncharacterized protein n=1 Tax=Scylla olivacea TaxID=85551 RepID=A0A0P4WGZ3_SCYOL
MFTESSVDFRKTQKKTFSDAEMVKECMLEVTETLFEGKQKDDIKDKIKQIPLSDSTAMRRTAIVAEDLTSQLDNAMQNASCISLAVDKSTDATDSAQLLVFVRFYDIAQKGFCEDLLGVASLEARTRGEDIYEAMKMMLRERGLDLKSVVSITTDGAPSMIGRERGLVGRLKEDHPDLISYHCIIHQSILCASFGGDYAVIMEKIMKLANFLRASSSLQHRLLRNFLSEVSASYDDLLLHNNVRWLSKGKVLERFWSIRKEVQEFLRSQQSAAKANKFLDFLEDEKEMEKTAFLQTSLFISMLSMSNYKEKTTVCDLISSVQAFQKLELFKNDLQGELHHFPRLLEHTKGKKGHNYTEFIDKLIGNFKDRFGDFSLGSLLLLFIQNPFMVSNVTLFSHEAKQVFKWVNAASVQMELIDLHENMILKEESAQYDPVTFWTQKVLRLSVEQSTSPTLVFCVTNLPLYTHSLPFAPYPSAAEQKK